MPNVIQTTELPVAILLLREWKAARDSGRDPLPRLFAVFDDEAPIELAVACDSLFALVEAILARPLATGVDGEVRLTYDERGILMLIRHGRQAGPIVTSRQVPHGLPGVLSLAAFAVQRALREMGELHGEASELPAVPGSCPFADTSRSGLAA